ncbi:MAG: hypothetical protein ACI9XO_000077 [Paraglaciecola sp.]|jgi:hypothetical protein
MRIIILFCCFFITMPLFGQDFGAKNKALGFGLGIPFSNTTLPEGRKYIPYQLLGYYTLHNFSKKKKNNFWLYVEPQWVLVFYDPKHDFDMEFGANLGIKYEFNFGKTTLLTAAIGAGPHVISAVTTDQYRGFIFSDNMEIGIRQLFKNSDWEVHLKARWRHISNANLKKPNDGIDTYLIVVGVAKQLTN